MQLATLGRYFALPLKSAPLLVIIIFSLLLGLASRAGLFGLPLALILLSWFFKYAFVLLDTTTDGVSEPPALSLEMVNPVSEQRSFILLIGVVGIFFLSNAASYWFGPVFGTLLALTIVVVLPAIIGVQGATGSLLQSLNLARCVRLITRLGRDYVLIVVCAAVLLAVAIFVATRSSIPLLLRLAFDMYAWFAMFALIGGVLFERRLDIGLESAYAPERIDSKAAKELDRERDQLMDRIYAEWRGGAHVNACKTITEVLSQTQDPAEELEWMYEKTAQWPDPRLANQLVQTWLPHLFSAKRHGRLIEVVRQRLAVDPGFRPATTNELLRCARLAKDGGERRVARQLLVDFAQRYPNDPLRPVAAELTQQLER